MNKIKLAIGTAASVVYSHDTGSCIRQEWRYFAYVCVGSWSNEYLLLQLYIVVCHDV